MDFNIAFENAEDNTPITKKDLKAFEDNIKEEIKKAERKILKEIQQNQDSLKRSLTRILQETKMKKSGHKSSCKEILPKKPFQNIDDFKKFEKDIQDDGSKFENLVDDLSKIICSGTDKFIKTAWRKILTDAIAQNLCWKGTTTKMAVRALSTTTALQNAFAKKFPHSSDDEFTRTSIAFFQHAKGRLIKRTAYTKDKNGHLES